MLAPPSSKLREFHIIAIQLATARLYGFSCWRRLVAYVKALRYEENQPRQPGENPPQSFSDGLKQEVTSAEAKAQLVYDKAAKGVAHNKFAKFQRRTRHLAMMTDTLKAQEFLSNEYGMLTPPWRGASLSLRRRMFAPLSHTSFITMTVTG